MEESDRYNTQVANDLTKIGLLENADARAEEETKEYGEWQVPGRDTPLRGYKKGGVAYQENGEPMPDGAAELVMGVCVGTISADSYGFIQVGGHCPAVAVGSGTATAITINEPLVACTTAPGSVMGVSGSTDADLMEVAATPLMSLQAVNADTAGYIEAFIKGLV